MKNRRGIFLTSVLGEVLEKVILKECETTINSNMFQNGGRKNRSTKDNWIATMTILERDEKLNQNTYILFADADGMREREEVKL